MCVTPRKIIFVSLSTALFFTVFLAGCTSISTPKAKTSIPIVSTVPQTPVPPSPTNTVLVATKTLTPTPAIIPYTSLSDEDKLERSVALIEQANNFSGEVVVPMNINGTIYNFYWCPTAIDKYDAGLAGAWKTEASCLELDRAGETLPPIIVAGYETSDGLVAVDLTTGEETFYPNQNIPAFGGVITYRDLLSIPQRQLAENITQAILSDPDVTSNPALVEIIEHLDDQSVYLPVLLWGEQTSVFAQGFDNGGGAGQDIPEQRYSAIEVLTNNGLMPIYSPETGEFMFFINIQVGDPLSQYTVSYRPDGSNDFATVYTAGNGSYGSFGFGGQDQFGIIAQSRFVQVAHNIGGGGIFIEASPAMGQVDVIEQIMKASTEEEILKTLNEYRLLGTYPTIVYKPDR